MERPFLRLVERVPGSGDALVLIKGFLSEEDAPAGTWLRQVREGGWKGSVYHLWWDASSPERAVRRTAIITAAGAVLGMSGLVGLASGAAGTWLEWKKMKRRAKRVGREHVARLTTGLAEERVSLLGFSLGARVVYYALLEALAQRGRPYQDAVLLGAAIGRSGKTRWDRAVLGLSGKLVNVYSGRDPVLAGPYLSAERNKPPAGLKPIKAVHPRIVNVSATKLCEDHFGYRRLLGDTVGPVLWGPLEE